MRANGINRTNRRERISIFIVWSFLLLCAPVASVFALAAPVELELNTIIPTTGEFIINAASPVEITIGEIKIIGYTYTGNQLAKLTITSAHASGTQMRMKHLDADAYIPYAMTCDYGNGFQSPVTHGTAHNLEGFDGEYDIAGTFRISTDDTGMYLAGDYQDTITFLVEAQ